MLVHLEILIFSIICFELINLFKLRLHFQNLVNLHKKLIKLFLSKKISDYWKSKVILRYSLLIFKSSLMITLLILMLLILYFSLNYFDKDFGVYILSIYGILETAIIILTYYKVRNLFCE